MTDKPGTSRIRRIVTRASVFLLLGAIVNVAVAWWIHLHVDGLAAAPLVRPPTPLEIPWWQGSAPVGFAGGPDGIFSRARVLQALGFKAADAVPVACAEIAKSDVLLSCDDRLCRTATRNRTALGVRVMNPIKFLQEQTHASNT